MSKLRKFAKISAIVAAIVLSLVLFGYGILTLAVNSELKDSQDSGEHVAQVDWLPKEASDVTYRKLSGDFWLLCYECALPRDAFDRFAKTKGWDVKEARTANANAFRPMLNLPPVKQSNPAVGEYPLTLQYAERKPNGGGITVEYNLETQRLFVWESSN